MEVVGFGLEGVGMGFIDTEYLIIDSVSRCSQQSTGKRLKVHMLRYIDQERSSILLLLLNHYAECNHARTSNRRMLG